MSLFSFGNLPMTTKVVGANRRRSKQTVESRRKDGAFWAYCKRAASAAQQRSKVRGWPCTIDGYFIDQLMVDQDWRCAVSGVLLEPPPGIGKGKRSAFAPSIDRIVPSLGYVPGNVRVVAWIVNAAMNEWGQEALMQLIDAMKRKAP